MGPSLIRIIDLLEAGIGADIINAADGNAEIVRCGLGGDTVTADPNDDLHGC